MNAYESACLAARILSYLLFATAIPGGLLSIIAAFMWIYRYASESPEATYSLLEFLAVAIPALFVLTAAIFVRRRFADLAFFGTPSSDDPFDAVAVLSVVPLTAYGIWSAFWGLRKGFVFLQVLELSEQRFEDLPNRWAHVMLPASDVFIGATFAFGAKYWMLGVVKLRSVARRRGR